MTHTHTHTHSQPLSAKSSCVWAAVSASCAKSISPATYVEWDYANLSLVESALDQMPAHNWRESKQENGEGTWEQERSVGWVEVWRSCCFRRLPGTERWMRLAAPGAILGLIWRAETPEPPPGLTSWPTDTADTDPRVLLDVAHFLVYFHFQCNTGKKT